MMKRGQIISILVFLSLCLCIAGPGCTSRPVTDAQAPGPADTLSAATPSIGTSPGPLPGLSPDPVFPEPETVHERRQYTPAGGISRSSVGKTIRNNGAGGTVYLEVRAGDLTYSKVFFMEAGETVEAWISFGFSFPRAAWSVRPAREGDTDQREITIEG